MPPLPIDRAARLWYLHHMKLAIVGGRDFADYGFMDQSIREVFPDLKEISEIVSGTNSPTGDNVDVPENVRGADLLAIKFAAKHGIPVKVFPANWRLGRGAGPMRNSKIVGYSDVMIAFPTPSSRGTHDSINKMRKANKDVWVFQAGHQTIEYHTDWEVSDHPNLPGARVHRVRPGGTSS